MTLIAKRWSHLLFPGHLSMAKDKAQLWAEAISAKLGFDARGCIMFVDGTEIQMCRPSIWQRLVFNGHKRYHSTGWQGLMAPNGIVVQLFGPCLGAYNDSKMIGLSRLIDVLDGDFPGFYVYADQGYGISPKIQHGFSNGTSTREERRYNLLWSRARICVEWGFGDVKEKFKTIDHTRSAKPLEQCIAVWYMVAVLLRNCLVCLRGHDEVSDHFVLRPPSLDDYLVPDGPRFRCWTAKYPPKEDIFLFAWYEAEQMGGRGGDGGAGAMDEGADEEDGGESE
jgi:hypothetical protein